ncbi:MAG: pyridoxamine 5'-phosphate oxidase family protein [Acidobacteria bacterium]|nr:pyridoxamine 5'-phosphate oxidase family protein [Acidobacteriota bacterium]
MINVEDMPRAEMDGLLRRVGFCHLGCVDGTGRPYVVPMNFAYDGEAVYFFTTEGMKTHNMDEHPEVCLQVEEIEDAAHWQSVMVFGRAERLAQGVDVEHAMQQITKSNPMLAPAINRTQIDSWGRANRIAVYRVRPVAMDGRRAVGADSGSV